MVTKQVITADPNPSVLPGTNVYVHEVLLWYQAWMN